MADIAWSAYALAMFTPEQRAAAVQAAYEPPPGLPLPPGPVGSLPGVVDSTSNSPVPGLDPNVPGDLKKIYEAGWRYEAGRWLNGTLGVVVNPDGATASSSSGRMAGSLSSVTSASSIGGGVVLGFTVPAAAPVLLPQWVGGRVGRVVVSGGMRPESGGTPLVKRGTSYSWNRVVR